MTILNRLINFLTPYVKDNVLVAESEIRQFVKEHNIFLRDDHLHFLMNFASESNGRIKIFKNYGGDFEFKQFARVYLENHPDMALPDGYTYFGSDFIGESFCIEHMSGKIFTYDMGERYGIVHESIAGFLLNCLLMKDYEQAFDKVTVQDLDSESFAEFRLENENTKIDEATRFVGQRDQILADTEYYLLNGKLTKLFLPGRIMTTMSGGILDEPGN
ncbi:hypothetical protein UNDKW_5591 [Undibacterium sp. KW1]|uniref:hypothetical protein n=1 Tax=Undibacterium sp. KW1 TaxID=2058624 RepID=UPI001331D58C|nr:hypothetical protein [Undibacterium sp. KW1]BBB63864.1 hypothetical protein UNDKW_5591 [Undibacterium sp. KW1]